VEEEKIESDEMKMKANKTRNELKVSDSNTYRLKTEERQKFFTESPTEMFRKHYGIALA